MNRQTEDIIEKVLKGEADQEDNQAVVGWFATREGQDYLSAHIDRNYEKKSGDALLYDVPTSNMWQHIESSIRISRTKKQVIRWMKYAAILLPFIFLYAGFRYIDTRMPLFGKPEMAELYVPKGQHTHFVFQDGTSVYLGPESHLSYPLTFGAAKREVCFSGEAYFEVAENRDWPFSLQVGNAEIRVLGTSFGVTAYPDSAEIKVRLDKGSVHFIPTDSTRKVYPLIPGESVTYDKVSHLVQINKEEKHAYLPDYKNNSIQFTDACLKQVLDVLSRNFNIQFAVRDEIVLTYKYTIRLEDKPLPVILKNLERITPVRFEKKDSLIIVGMK